MHAKYFFGLALLLACSKSTPEHKAPDESDHDENDQESSDSAKFSFFVTSLQSLRELSGSQSGFGGDLRFGETGEGAGLRGADKICATIADASLPGSAGKRWRAFLSASTVDARDRIGDGPWFDRKGRLVADDLGALLSERPGADPTIMNDLPNEFGVPNHDPDGTGQVDNHDVLTGTNSKGQLYCANDPASCTCADWTSAMPSGRPRVGHAWPRSGTAIDPGGFGGFDFGALFDGGVPGFPEGGFPGFAGFPPFAGSADGGLPSFPAGASTGGGFPGGGFDIGSFSQGDGSMNNWMSALDEAGCAPGVSLIEMGPPQAGNPTVGSGGGYGSFYCFALEP